MTNNTWNTYHDITILITGSSFVRSRQLKDVLTPLKVLLEDLLKALEHLLKALKDLLKPHKDPFKALKDLEHFSHSRTSLGHLRLASALKDQLKPLKEISKALKVLPMHFRTLKDT